MGGGEAELAPALGAWDHLAGDEPGCAEQLGRFDHLALAQGDAHRSRRHRAAFVFERRHDVDREAEPLALFRKIIRRAAAVLPEMEIEADGRAADAKFVD